jgi:hypothetical protein
MSYSQLIRTASRAVFRVTLARDNDEPTHPKRALRSQSADHFELNQIGSSSVRDIWHGSGARSARSPAEHGAAA